MVTVPSTCRSISVNVTQSIALKTVDIDHSFRHAYLAIEFNDMTAPNFKNRLNVKVVFMTIKIFTVKKVSGNI